MTLPKAHPAELGLDAATFSAALHWLRERCGANGLDETVIIYRHHLVYEGARARRSGHTLYSCTKSILSSVAGLLISEGRCALGDYAADIEPLLAAYYPTVTLQQLLTMTSGYNAVGQSRWGEPSLDWSPTPYQPAPPLFTPGSHFCYWDEATLMLGCVLTRLCGMTLKDYLDARLFGYLGIAPSDWSWWAEEAVDGVPICMGGTGITLSAYHAACYTYLMSQRGRWHGQQLLPERWVAQATQVQVDAALPVAPSDRADICGAGCYGLLWWVGGSETPGRDGMPRLPSGTFFARGIRNNMMVAVPAWEFVVVRLGNDADPPEGKASLFEELLLRLREAW